MATRLTPRVLRNVKPTSWSKDSLLSSSARRRFSSSSKSSQSTAGSGGQTGSSSQLPKLLLVGVGGAATFAIAERLLASASKEPKSHSIELPTTYASPEELAKAIDELKAAFPESQINTKAEALRIHGSSEVSYHGDTAHAIIVKPLSTEDVVKVVNISKKYKIPIMPYSGATSLEGHIAGHPAGSICLDVSRMNKIIQINEQDADIIVQPGVQWEVINQTLKDKGIPLFFPLDPGPGATIGGMIGTGCSGTNAVRYGTARGEWFLNVTVVLPNGEVVKTRQRARKSSTGFDTTKLFVGAEGTLGIVTEATLRLAPRVPYKVAMAQFPNVQKAVDAVQEILTSTYGMNMQCVELLDDNMMAAIGNSGLGDKTHPARDTLFFKIQGDAKTVKNAADVVKSITKKHGSSGFDFAATDEEADDMWQQRKYALMSTMAIDPTTRCWTTDVCVPVSKLPQLVRETKEDLATTGLTNTIVGHVGDGNFHALILFHENEFQAVTDAVHRMVHRAIALDGTCTGEHGIGLGKKEYLNEELGEGTVRLMKTVKNAIDPHNLMNPTKLYPDPLGAKKSSGH